MQPAGDWRLIGAVLFGLLMFGLVYNELVQRIGRRKEGYTSLLVVGGVLITLGGVALVSWQCAVLTLSAFAASGLPMTLGSIYRHIRSREQAIEYLRREAIEAMERDEQA
jgi:hypothetical protein